MVKGKLFVVLALSMIFLALFALLVWSYVGSDVEQSRYTVILSAGDVEIRNYAPMIVAEVEVSGEREEAIKTGFKILAEYIFGDNVPQEKIEMTAPVIQTPREKIAMTAPVMQESQNGSWRVRFMMPNNYTLASLPRPNNKKIQIKELPNKKIVVIRFSGLPTESILRQKRERLEGYIKENRLKVSAAPAYAFFNPPWTLPPLRRTEIMAELKN